MPHLHLPTDHTDADIALAASIAEAVGSEELYVAWSHDGGPGAVPAVEALVREERAASAFGRLLTAVAAAFAAFWRALFRRPAHRTTAAGEASDRPPQHATGEPFA